MRKREFPAGYSEKRLTRRQSQRRDFRGFRKDQWSSTSQRAWLIFDVRQKMNAQIVGNVGLYFVCYELSKRGWNVMPTARNAKGVDIIAYDLTATRYIGVQVKALSKKSPVPLGNSLDRVMGDFWIVVNNLDAVPGIYILRPEEVRARAHRGVKEERVSFWLQPKSYMLPEFEARWERIEEKKPNKAPEPTPGLQGFSQGSEISNLVAGVAHL